MIKEDLVFVCCSDIAGQVRGKGVPLTEWEDRRETGVGWTPTNVQITAFDAIADSPFAALGDLFLMPVQETEVKVDFDDGTSKEHFFLGNVVHTDGRPWECCLRSILVSALDALKAETGLTLIAAFEHEFQFLDDDVDHGSAYSLPGYRAERDFAASLLAGMRIAGLHAHSFLREYGDRQYEVTVTPQHGVKAADQAVILREIARSTAIRLGKRVTFTPLRDPAGVGNGLHIHFSFRDADGNPATHDPAATAGLAQVPGSFAAGILKYLPSIVAFTAPSVVSYARLTPHRWSATYNNLGYRDREASLRIAPVHDGEGADSAAEFNLEYRAADSAASPHLQLAAVVLAGLQGVREALPTPTPTEEDLSILDEQALAARGVVRLPTSLAEALDRLAADGVVRGWFDELFFDVYLKHKHGEIAHLDGMPIEEMCAAYERVY